MIPMDALLIPIKYLDHSLKQNQKAQKSQASEKLAQELCAARRSAHSAVPPSARGAFYEHLIEECKGKKANSTFYSNTLMRH